MLYFCNSLDSVGSGYRGMRPDSVRQEMRRGLRFRQGRPMSPADIRAMALTSRQSQDEDGTLDEHQQMSTNR